MTANPTTTPALLLAFRSEICKNARFTEGNKLRRDGLELPEALGDGVACEVVNWCPK